VKGRGIGAVGEDKGFGNGNAKSPGPLGDAKTGRESIDNGFHQ